MHTRKATMYKISDYFVAMPVGIGPIRRNNGNINMETAFSSPKTVRITEYQRLF
jgi:hypothetical protein